MILGHYQAANESEEEKKQGLEEHLINVAESARQSANSIGQGDVLFLLGLYHDLGKSDRLFQKKLKEEPGLHVDHSYAGARYLFQEIVSVFQRLGRNSNEAQLFREIMAYIISAHHGVYDVPLPEDMEGASKYRHSKLFYRIGQPREDYHYKEDVEVYAKLLEERLPKFGYQNLDDLVSRAFKNFQSAWARLSITDDSEAAYYSSCFIRLYLSYLKNADILDTINAYDLVLEPKTAEENGELVQKYFRSVEEVYAGFGNPTTELNRIRTALGERVKQRGANDSPGIYRLNLPTGAGKTNLSLRYAVHQLTQKGKKRFFYMTPFLSVLEQNAASIQEIIGKEGVLEHHSNLVREQQDTAPQNEEYGEETINSLMTDYLVDTWDSPVVLTTMVQFFQSLFKTKSANVRRFSSLANSILILDEVQSLPIEVTTLFNLTMNFLSRIMGATVILCTATQPAYDSEAISHQLLYGGEMAEQADIVALTAEEQEVFTRTELRKFDESDTASQLSDLASFILEEESSMLVILNTKPAVEKLYSLLEFQTARPLYHLSTNMCAQHRLDVIQEIKGQLEKNVPLICISTQLIEAGVDVDFERVVRSYAGLDSIVQAAGRCNREGKRGLGQVTLINLYEEEESLTYLKEIKHKKEATEKILIKVDSPIDAGSLNRLFFESYYANNRNLLDYPLSSNESVYDYLSLSTFKGSLNCQIRQSFKTAGQKMDLIKDDSIGVLVPYGDGAEEIADLEERLVNNPYPRGQDLVEIKQILKSLQPFTVNLRKYDSRLQAVRYYLEGQVLILQEEYYDKEKLGLTKEANLSIL
ncbi:CRISPR-associated helicase Cas3' [Streptococcus ferus]|uniref:CRISPR-associated helicase Cas3' n=1 Tax=Streptococcus ferus TaxID=1345 RepID=UPI003515FD84